MGGDGMTIETTGTVLLIPRDAAGKATGLLALLEPKDAPGTYRLTCFGPKRHYRKDGSCRCVAATLALMTAEARAATTVDPFGGQARG